MTIVEAINVLKGQPGPQFILEGKEAYLACQLGIEALKRIKKERLEIGRWHARILPGETED